MYGKFYESTFTGSMIGAGSNVFALWGYIISHTKPDSHVELNPILLSTLIGCPTEQVEQAIEYLSSPDEKSRSSNESGRRITKVSPFLYHVTNYNAYRTMRDEEDRKEYMRNYMRKYRKPVKVNSKHGKPQLAAVSPSRSRSRSRSKKQSKETKETPQAAFAVKKLPKTKNAVGVKTETACISKIPTEQEFQDEIDYGGLLAVSIHRPNLYSELAANGWRVFDKKSKRWSPIVDWRAFIRGIDRSIESAALAKENSTPKDVEVEHDEECPF